MPLEEVKPQCEKKRHLRVVLAHAFTKLNSHSINTNSHSLNQEKSIQSYEFYKDQISSMAMDGQLESKEQFKGLIEEFLFEEET